MACGTAVEVKGDGLVTEQSSTGYLSYVKISKLYMRPTL
jgi:hypothetical protein